MSFNGDDFQALVRGTGDAASFATADIVDQIGLFTGADPGEYWPVCGSGSGMDTRNGRMTRDAGTCCGDTTGAAFQASFFGTCAWTEPADTAFVSAWASSATCAAVSTPLAPPRSSGLHLDRWLVGGRVWHKDHGQRKRVDRILLG